jgi:hypothetical protein
MTSQNNKSIMIRLITIAAGFTVAISAAYCWLLPKFFNSYRTYSILVVGTLAAGLFAWLTSFKSLDTGAGAKRIILPICYGLALAVIVFFVSLLFIANTRGT